jgi:hypothetical protein
MRSLFCLLALPLLGSASPVLNVATIDNGAAPILSSSHSKEIPNSYIVVFKKHVNPAAASQHHEWVHSLHASSEETRQELRKRSQIPLVTEMFEGLKHTFTIGDLLGYAGHFDSKVIDAVRRHPDVSFTECSTTQLRLSFLGFGAGHFDDFVSAWSWLALENPAFHWLLKLLSLFLSTQGLTYLSHRLNTLSKIRKCIRWRKSKPSRMRPGA